MSKNNTPLSWREKMHEVIYEADTFAGKLFDIVLLWAILISVVAVMLDSVKSITITYGENLRAIEWFFTILFTVEYLARIICVKKPIKYMTSFLGLVDFISIIPSYLSLFILGTESFLIIRSIRLLRIFRIFKFARYVHEAQSLVASLRANRPRIIVFVGGVLTIVSITGTIMYIVEGESSGFTSIPKSTYWAIVTLTTVGYGDIAPITPLGQIIASFIMILGYGILAASTGFVTVQLHQSLQKKKISTQACSECSEEGHDDDAIYCKYCGSKL